MNIPLGSSSWPLFSGCWFLRREENRRTQSKTLGARTGTSNHLNPEVHSRFVPTVVSRPNAVDSYPSLSRFAPKPICWSIRTQIVDWFIHLFEILHVLAQAKTDILTRKVYCLWFTYLFSWLDYKVYLSQNQWKSFSVSQLQVIK